MKNIYLEEKSLYRFGVFTSKNDILRKVIFPVFKPKIGVCKNSLRWIHAHLVGSLHLELIHGGTGLGDIQLVVVLTGHCVGLLSCLICAFALVGYRTHSFSQRWTNMRCGGW